MDSHEHRSYARQPGDTPPVWRLCPDCRMPFDVHGQEVHANVERLEALWHKAKFIRFADPVLVLSLLLTFS